MIDFAEGNDTMIQSKYKNVIEGQELDFDHLASL